MTEPSMINVNIDDAGEFDTLPGNSEHVLEIIRVDEEDSKSRSGVTNLHLRLDAGDPSIDDIHVWVPLPNDGWKAEDPKSYKKAVNRFLQFKTCFGFEMPVESSRLLGLTGLCLVSAEADDRNPGKFRNGVMGFQTGGGA